MTFNYSTFHTWHGSQRWMALGTKGQSAAAVEMLEKVQGGQRWL